MNPDSTPNEPHPQAVEAQLAAWIALRDQMQQLHAELEYVKLMLTLGVGPR